MTSVKLRGPQGRFTVRVAGIAIRKGRVLLHEDRDGLFWALPGGRLEVGEEVRETLRREMAEETGMAVEVGRLVWVMENFFELRGKRCHEIGFYFEMEVPEESGPEAQPAFTGREGEGELHFRWIPLEAIGRGVRVEPRALAQRLHELPPGTEHLVYLDDRGQKGEFT